MFMEKWECREINIIGVFVVVLRVFVVVVVLRIFVVFVLRIFVVVVERVFVVVVVRGYIDVFDLVISDCFFLEMIRGFCF